MTWVRDYGCTGNGKRKSFRGACGALQLHVCVEEREIEGHELLSQDGGKRSLDTNQE